MQLSKSPEEKTESSQESVLEVSDSLKEILRTSRPNKWFLSSAKEADKIRAVHESGASLVCTIEEFKQLRRDC